jgi:transcriptional regulator with XRE-family HTH domain
MDIAVEIGSRIRFHRRQLGLSQEDLAERSDLSFSFIGQLERGAKQPTIDSLYRITKGMDLSLSDFLKDMEIVDKDADSYAIKSYLLIEQEDEHTQRHLYEIVKHILAIKQK